MLTSNEYFLQVAGKFVLHVYQTEEWVMNMGRRGQHLRKRDPKTI